MLWVVFNRNGRVKRFGPFLLSAPLRSAIMGLVRNESLERDWWVTQGLAQ